MKTRLIEIYVGTFDNTWYTTYVDIPLDTKDENIRKVSIDVAQLTIKNYVFLGVYNITEIDDI